MDHFKISIDIDKELAEIDQVMSTLDIHRDQALIDQWIKDYKPFILATVSWVKNEYVHIENDESYSVALLAFVEAIDRYDITKGPFLPFCKLVITSRVKNQLKQDNKHHHLNIEDHLQDISIHATYSTPSPNTTLEEEIKLFEAALLRYGIPFSTLIDNSPKHHDTKTLVIETAQKIYMEEDLMAFLHDKKRLPITQIAERFFLSIKTLKSYKAFIIAILVILENDLIQIKDWIGFKK